MSAALAANNIRCSHSNVETSFTLIVCESNSKCHLFFTHKRDLSCHHGPISGTKIKSGIFIYLLSLAVSAIHQIMEVRIDSVIDRRLSVYFFIFISDHIYT